MKLFAVLLTLLVTAAAGLAIAANGTVAFTPGAMHWIAGTGASKGSSLATLAGNPNKSGMSVIRVKMPDGYTNTPHYHAHPEYITVIQGTVLLGMGDTINKAKAKAYPAGSFIMVPTGVHHWSVAKGDTIEQVSGEGPLTNIPIKHGAM